MTWAEQAEKLAAGAQRARLAGDHVAMISLLTAAAQCAKIGALLSRTSEDRDSQTKNDK